MDLIDVYYQTADSNFPVKLPDGAKELGAGSKGAVFDAGSGKILKITTDMTEAKATSLIVGKKFRGIWKIHGVYQSKRFGKDIYKISRSASYSVYAQKLWFIIGEKLKDPNDKEVDDILYIIKEVLIVRASTYMTKKRYDDLVEYIEMSMEVGEIESFSKNIPTQKITDKQGQGVLDLLTGLYNMNKVGISWEDLHRGNVMKRGNEYVWVDLGYSQSPEGTIKTFEQIGPYKVEEKEYRDKHNRPSAAKRGYGHAWRKKREEILSKGPMCSVCKKKKATHVDHERRLKKGGSNGDANLRPLCQSCHNSKSAKEKAKDYKK